MFDFVQKLEIQKIYCTKNQKYEINTFRYRFLNLSERNKFEHNKALTSSYGGIVVTFGNFRERILEFVKEI